MTCQNYTSQEKFCFDCTFREKSPTSVLKGQAGLRPAKIKGDHLSNTKGDQHVKSARIAIQKPHLVLSLLVVVFITVMSAQPAAAAGFDFSDLQYSVVALGNGHTFGLNSGPNAGSFLLGNGVTANFSGGGSGSIAGGLFFDASTLGQNTFGMLATPPTLHPVSGPGAGTVTGNALSQADADAMFAAGLTPNLTIPGTISSATTFNAAGPLTVIDVTNIQNAPLTFNGTASDFFVVNVAGTYQTNVMNMLTGGVTAANILFNFTGTSGNVFQTSGGNSVQGTFLATDGGSFNFANLNLNGQLINTDGNIQLVSGSEVTTFTPFTPPVPEPASLTLVGVGLLGLGLGLRRKKSI